MLSELGRSLAYNRVVSLSFLNFFFLKKTFLRSGAAFLEGPLRRSDSPQGASTAPAAARRAPAAPSSPSCRTSRAPRAHQERVLGPKHHVERKGREKSTLEQTEFGQTRSEQTRSERGRGGPRPHRRLERGRPCAMSAAPPERAPAPAGQGAARGPCGPGDTPVCGEGHSATPQPRNPRTAPSLPGTQARAGVLRRGGAALCRSPRGSAGPVGTRCARSPISVPLLIPIPIPVPVPLSPR